MNRDADLVERRVLDGETHGAGDALLAGLDGHVGVAERDSFEVRVIRAHDVEQHVVAVAVEDDFAVAGGLDRDRPLGRAVLRQIERAVPRRAAARAVLRADLVAVAEPVEVLVLAGVHENRVAGLHARRGRAAPVAAERVLVVRGEQPCERRLLLRPRVAERIDVIGRAAGVGLRLCPCAHVDDALRVTADAVGVGEREAHLVLGVLGELEDAACEHVRRRVIERLDVEGALVLHAQQGQTFAPVALAGAPIRHGDGRVAVGVTVDVPLEAERDQRRRLDDELQSPHLDLRLRLRVRCHEASQRCDPESNDSKLLRAHFSPIDVVRLRTARVRPGLGRYQPNGKRLHCARHANCTIRTTRLRSHSNDLHSLAHHRRPDRLGR